MSRNWTLGILSFKDLTPLEEDRNRSQNLSLRQSLGNLVSRQRHIFSCFECDRQCCFVCVKSRSQVINSQRHPFPSTLEKSPQLVLILELCNSALWRGRKLRSWKVELLGLRYTAWQQWFWAFHPRLWSLSKTRIDGLREESLSDWTLG